MSDAHDFLPQLRDALDHLYDYAYLQSHPLARRCWPDDPARGQRLHRLLLETIEQLYPPTEAPSDAALGRNYFLLVYRYVERWQLPAILRELACSRRQFFREQARALTALAALLQERLPELEMSQGAAWSTSEDLLACEAERLLEQREAVDVADLIDGLLPVAQALAQRHGAALRVAVERPLPLVSSNRTVLRQVLLKALGRLLNQPTARSIEARVAASGAEVVVELTGRDARGARLVPPAAGSDAVRRLVELVGGRWREEGGGRCVLRLVADGRKGVVLVVEDNEALIHVFQRYLSGHPYTVVGAANGAEALRLARDLRPCAITLDVMIPHQDGWEILQALKNEPATSAIPVIVCSVLDDPELARMLGAAAYLRKPVTQADLLDALAQLA